MKTFFVIIVFLHLGLKSAFGATSKLDKELQIVVLESKYAVLDSIATSIYNETSIEYASKEAIVINIQTLKEGMNVKFALVNKAYFGRLLNDYKESFSGYLQMNGIPIVVFGDSSEIKK